MSRRSPPAPHLVPYQGSKRVLAPAILAQLAGRRFARLWEPFCGSAALTLAAARADVADRYVLADVYRPLAALWRLAIDDPDALADAYAIIHAGHDGDPGAHYLRERERFHDDPAPARLLYLLARAVKNAPRWSRAGRFNQSPDHRRQGLRPERVRAQARAVAALLRGRCEVRCGDGGDVLADAAAGDLAYLDPPWVGTSEGRDRRYAQGLNTAALCATIASLRGRGVALLLSYDGRTGDRPLAPELPAELGLRRCLLDGGRSSQATLLGRSERTIESLYVGDWNGAAGITTAGPPSCPPQALESVRQGGCP